MLIKQSLQRRGVVVFSRYIIGLAKYGTRINMETGCGTSEMLMAGCGIKLLGGERILLILTGEVGIVLTLTPGCGMKNSKSQVMEVPQRASGIEINLMSGAGCRD